VTGETKWAFPLGEANRLLARADLGFTLKEDFEELPASVRYFAGGDNSVRGYGFETLGPTNEEGDVIGGSYLATFSVEFDRLISKKWSVAAFVDTGNAFDSLDFDFKTGVGLGLRWYSPLGPIRLDVAHPLDDPDRDYRLHITLGPDL
jgi:translocation and assembly module TamA